MVIVVLFNYSLACQVTIANITRYNINFYLFIFFKWGGGGGGGGWGENFKNSKLVNTISRQLPVNIL